MRKSLAILIIAATVAVAIPAFADLQNVVVGGSIRIRGNYWTSEAGPDSWTARNPLYQGWWTNSFRPVGNPLAGFRWPAQPGRLAVFSGVDWNESGSGVKFVEQRTKLNVRADFTDQVSAFIELDSYDVWGEDFRSNYLTGIDNRGWTGDDVEVYQSYIEANEMFGYPVRLRVGRQELKFGSGWLVGTNDADSFFRGLSFDAVRATYADDMFSVDAFWAKLAERGTIEEDADTDMYGVYASYLGIENITLDAYWFWVRDGIKLNDTNLGWVGEWWEDVVDVDDYDHTSFHTVGLRGAGTYGAFDFDAEVAYQWGKAAAIGNGFAAAGLISPYGDDSAEYGEFAGNLQVGYTFDMNYSPRVFVGGAYFGGEDNRDVNFWEWLGAVACPFWSKDASVSFNRMFSDYHYSNFVAALNHDCTNLWLAYLGVTAKPTEKLAVTVSGAYVQALEAYNRTWPLCYEPIGWTRYLPFNFFSFADKENDDDLCWEVDVNAVYNYSADLSFEVGYSHLFLGDGAAEGAFVLGNGTQFTGGTDDEDADYVYFETKLSF